MGPSVTFVAFRQQGEECRPEQRISEGGDDGLGASPPFPEQSTLKPMPPNLAAKAGTQTSATRHCKVPAWCAGTETTRVAGALQ